MPKKKPLSFRPDADLEERFLKILGATGLSVNALIDRCVRRSLDSIASEAIEERRKAESLYLSELPAPYRAKAPPKRKAG